MLEHKKNARLSFNDLVNFFLEIHEKKLQRNYPETVGERENAQLHHGHQAAFNIIWIKVNFI